MVLPVEDSPLKGAPHTAAMVTVRPGRKPTAVRLPPSLLIGSNNASFGQLLTELIMSMETATSCAPVPSY